MLKQKLSQKMLQKLSPQQIQLMKLLQIPTATLDQRVQEELEANPALEEGSLEEDRREELESEREEEDPLDDFELDDYLEEYIEDDPMTYKYRGNNYSPDEEENSVPIPVERTFHEHLEQQLGMKSLEDDRAEKIARQIIGSIDEDGYLRREPEAIIDDLLFSYNIDVTKEEVEELVDLIQNFDPPGVGARDLRECLLIQLERKIKRDEKRGEDHEIRQLAYKLLDEQFDAFSKKHYSKLKKQLNIDTETLRDAIDEILKLNPKPASGLEAPSTRNNNYVVPDFIIKNEDGELSLSLNSKNAPELHINTEYKNMLRKYKDNTKGRRPKKKEKEAVLFIKQKIDSAKWFIDAIRQRQNTLYRTMYAIMQYQYDYFLSGDERLLRPMILKDIAEITGLDISTVSRVANSKFVQTEFGTRRLKDFFSESIQKQNGEEVSTIEVKQILKDIIAGEDKKKPYSDEKLKNILKDKGYSIARRTVAKYREQLNIPVARLRKEL